MHRIRIAAAAVLVAASLVAPAYAAPVHGSYTALVQLSCCLKTGNGATNATRLGPGLTEVDFVIDVSACAYVATLGDNNAKGPVFPGFVSVAAQPGNPLGVLVQANTRTGRPHGMTFHLDVGC